MAFILVLLFAFFALVGPASASPSPSGNSGKAQEQRQADPSVRGTITGCIDRLEQAGRESGNGRTVVNKQLRRFYHTVKYRAVWTNRLAIGRLLEVIRASEEDGLQPEEYHLAEILRLYDHPPDTPALKARADVLMTDAVFTLLWHMRSGKVNPSKLDPDWNLPAVPPGAAYDRKLVQAVMSSRFPEMVDELRPHAAEYRLLRKSLARLRETAAAGGWKKVSSGAVIHKVGQSDPRMPALRQRLFISGDLAADTLKARVEPAPLRGQVEQLASGGAGRAAEAAGAAGAPGIAGVAGKSVPAASAGVAEGMSGAASVAGQGLLAGAESSGGMARSDRSVLKEPVPASVASGSSMVYTPELFEAVKKFQKRHGLDVDGIIGNATIQAMNVPVRQRIDQIRVNLERYRWFVDRMGQTYIMVNIPSFTVEVVVDKVHRWSSRVIVGQTERKTPVFKAEMQYIILNPQWVVPPGILDKDALPAIKKNMAYLKKKNLAVVDENGQVLNPSTIKWSKYTEGNGFPYRLVQASGDEGSLGRIKFMLPNRYMVYLHDTPTKELFNKSRRTFSSGCIRVEHPLDLAEIVLQDTVKWNKTRILNAVETGKTRTVPLPRQMPVFILYQTVFVDGEHLCFYPDIYERDRQLLEELNSMTDSKSVESAAF